MAQGSVRPAPSYAPAHGPPRLRQVRTAFNMLGPLLNPAGAEYGLVGVYDTSISQLMADALMVRTGRRAMYGAGAGGSLLSHD